MKSEGGAFETIYEGDLDVCVDIYNSHGGSFTDTNGFEWQLEVEEEEY